MFNLDPGKLLIIAVVAVLLLGPDRLPQVARQAGGAWRTFNEFRHRMETEVRSSIPDLPSSSDIARLARSPSALLDHLSTMGHDADGPGTTSGPDPGPGSAGFQTTPPAPLPPKGPSEDPTASIDQRLPDIVVPGDPSLN